MRRVLLFLTLPFFFLFLFSSVQEAKRPFHFPRIQFSERYWDFGYVPKDIKVSHTFLIKNTGTDTLLITKVRPDCGCTHAPLSESRIAPNQTAELELIFNPQRFRGHINKAVAIICNDTTEPLSNITFTAEVGLENPMIKINPEGIAFDTLTPIHRLAKKVELKNISGTKLFISVVQKPRDFVDYQIEKLELWPEENTQIVFQTNPPLPPGIFRTSLTLDFTGSEELRCTIPIQGVVFR